VLAAARAPVLVRAGARLGRRRVDVDEPRLVELAALGERGLGLGGLDARGVGRRL